MEALSVVGSANGLISLSIQVVQSLVGFYSAYKTQEPDVAYTIEKLEYLLGVLENLCSQLMNRVFSADEQDLLKSIEDSIQGCEGYIQELELETEKLKVESTYSFRPTARTAAQLAIYPFRQSTLQKLDEDVNEIVSRLSLALQTLQQTSSGNVQDKVEDMKALQDLVRNSQVSAAIQEWLRAPDAVFNYNEACKKRYPGTGLWFVEGSSFATWLKKPNSFLWLNGSAGSGKSVLCSAAIQRTFRYRRSNPRIGIAFFFFAFNDDSKKGGPAMLRALILQLSSQLNNNHGHLLRLYRSYRNAMPSSQALVDCLLQLVREFDNVYVFLDALDEGSGDKPRGEMLQALVNLRAWSEPGLHLLVTSREEPDIRDELDVSSEETISMKNESVNSDIALFISGYIKNDYRLRKLRKHHDQIKKALIEGADGMFRWVQCQFEASSFSASSKRQLDALLATMPRSLDEIYERMLLNIDEQFVEDARRVLTMLCYAKRPLTVPELIDGIAVELGDDPRFNLEGRLDDHGDIHRVCPGLIEAVVDPDDGQTIVRIAHSSVKEYLGSERILQHAAARFSVRPTKAHAEIASICLTYMLEPALSRDSIDKYPLALYAARNWHEHYHDAKRITHHLEQQVIRLFRNSGDERGGSRLLNWVRLFNPDRPWDLSPDPDLQSTDIATPIYYTSSLGLVPVVMRLLEEGADPNAKGGGHGTPLQCAAYFGHVEIVTLLLYADADPLAKGGFYGTAIQAAKFAGNMEVLSLLSNAVKNLELQDTSVTATYEIDPPRHIVFETQEQVPFDVLHTVSCPERSASIVQKVRSRAGGFECANKTMFVVRGTDRYRTFITEVSIMQKLRHKHIVEVIGSYSCSFMCSILMSPIADSDLAVYMRGNEPDSENLARWLGCITDGLVYMHQMRIKHKDVKPQNILVLGNNVLWTDFGIAHEMAELDDVTRGLTAYTDMYSAPEVIGKRERTLATDIFSLGCVFAEMLTVICGKTLDELDVLRCRNPSDKSYRGENGRVTLGWLDGIFSDCASARGVPESMVGIMGRMLSDIPEERPSTPELGNHIPHTICKV